MSHRAILLLLILGLQELFLSKGGFVISITVGMVLLVHLQKMEYALLGFLLGRYQK
jgi:hypothetical protein